MIEDALAALKAAGWRLNNLYEQDNGQWVANARRPSGDGGTDLDFARGEGAAEALQALASKLGVPWHAPAFHLSVPPAAASAVSKAEHKACRPIPAPCPVDAAETGVAQVASAAPPAPGDIAQGELF